MIVKYPEILSISKCILDW